MVDKQGPCGKLAIVLIGRQIHKTIIIIINNNNNNNNNNNDKKQFLHQRTKKNPIYNK